MSYDGLLNFGGFDDLNYDMLELIIFVLMGAIGGLLGALYNYLNTKLTVFRMSNQGRLDARELAEKAGIEPVFEKEKVYVRRKKRMFDYESRDELVADPLDSFKINFYYPLFDTAVNAVKERFSQLNEVSGMFGFLYNIHNLKNKSSSEIKLLCHKLGNALKSIEEEGQCDVDALELCSELSGISQHLNENLPPQKLLNYIYHHNLENGFPNLCVALRILLKLPLSLASAERSFSKLKLIKTYLRSTMCQERLTGLAMISIESELASRINAKDLVKEFAKAKARKVPLGF